MAAPKSRLVPMLFTTLVTPILVSLAVRHLSSANLHQAQVRPMPIQKNAGYNPQHSAASSSSLPPVLPKRETIQVIGQGKGRTPSEALQDALRAALRSALTVQAEPGRSS